MTKNTANILIGLFIVIIFGVLIWLYAIKDNESDIDLVNEARLNTFTLEKPNFVARGSNLSAVKIWAVPTGTNIIERDYVLVGDASLESSQSDLQNQRWTLLVPDNPISATDIFAQGFDEEGNIVGKVSLPYSGVTEIYTMVWGPVVEKEYDLKVGQSATFEGLTVTLNRVTNDSRCMEGVQCITAGDVTAEVRAKTDNESKIISVKSVGNPASFGGYFIEITEVKPTKISANVLQSDYVITFTLSRDVKL